MLALRELQGLSYEEIAEVMETTAGGVAQLLLRARIAFRRELRIGQIDEERLAGGCRALLPEIVALIDDQLPAGREVAVTEHLSNCRDCRAVKAACEEAGQRYRAWLPLLGLGAGAARAAPWVAAAAAPPVTAGVTPGAADPTRGIARRHPLRRARAAVVGAGAILVIAVPLALPALTARKNPPEPVAAEPEPEIGSCVWCERLDEALPARAEPRLRRRRLRRRGRWPRLPPPPPRHRRSSRLLRRSSERRRAGLRRRLRIPVRLRLTPRRPRSRERGVPPSRLRARSAASAGAGPGARG